MRHRLPFRPSDYLIDQDWRSTVRSGTLAGENEGIYSSSSRPYFALDSDLRLLSANMWSGLAVCIGPFYQIC
ncbi:hypothetical protein DTO207G8_5577 [Paecilomyces variotii]|nr:hypothetical protein DTO207G8_5577 [Paecilomyces variotii]